jgi:hypothetical protein
LYYNLRSSLISSKDEHLERFRKRLEAYELKNRLANEIKAAIPGGPPKVQLKSRNLVAGMPNYFCVALNVLIGDIPIIYDESS